MEFKIEDFQLADLKKQSQNFILRFLSLYFPELDQLHSTNLVFLLKVVVFEIILVLVN